jgi:hypothetical protein
MEAPIQADDSRQEGKREVRAMSSLDIFQRLPNGARFWVCSARSLQEAKAYLLDLQRGDPGEYYLCDLMDRRVILASTQEEPELHMMQDDSAFWGQQSWSYEPASLAG